MSEQPKDGSGSAVLGGEYRGWTIVVRCSGVSFIATGSTPFARCRAGPIRNAHLAVSTIDAARCYEIAKAVLDEDYEKEAERVEAQARRDCAHLPPWVSDEEFLKQRGEA